MRGKVAKNSNIKTVSATEKGTPLVFYTPALTEKNTNLTFEIIFDEFPKKVVDSIAGAFTTAASSALLERFYHIGAGQEQPIDILMEAVGLYNDWHFRKRADGLVASLKDDSLSDEKRAKLQAEYEAYVANILNDDLKPKEE